MNDIQALLWDVDGTLAETERDGHRVAFNRAFEDAGLPWRWDEARYGELLAITGGRERILYDMRERGDAPGTGGEREALARDLHARKNRIYGEFVRQGRVSLRPGVMALLDETEQAGLRVGHRHHHQPRQCRRTAGRASRTPVAPALRRSGLRRGCAKQEA